MFNTSKNVWQGSIVAKKLWLPKVVDNLEGVGLKFVTKMSELNTLTSVCQTLTFQMSNLESSCRVIIQTWKNVTNTSSRTAHSWSCVFFHPNLDLEVLGKCFTHQCLLMFKVFAALLIHFIFFILPIYSQFLFTPCVISSLSVVAMYVFFFSSTSPLPFWAFFLWSPSHLISLQATDMSDGLCSFILVQKISYQ